MGNGSHLKAEPRPAADRDEPARTHLVCPWCHPAVPPPLGTPAVCGEKVLGVVPDERAVACGTCQEIEERPVWPCGHGWALTGLEG
ncbi:hypothetical protein [Streptomyces synnematoformans]|uniref:Uncharacterized protein n=1 Tax=Streptomyces synnematoformans TaxID=415721 RepID=A0ABN2XAQ9_9ACTN